MVDIVCRRSMRIGVAGVGANLCTFSRSGSLCPRTIHLALALVGSPISPCFSVKMNRRGIIWPEYLVPVSSSESGSTMKSIAEFPSKLPISFVLAPQNLKICSAVKFFSLSSLYLFVFWKYNTMLKESGKQDQQQHDIQLRSTAARVLMMGHHCV
jgi:hypothetical protein